MLRFIYELVAFHGWWHGYYWGVCDTPLWYFHSCLLGDLFEDVTTISYLFIIIAWFIAYIEIGRYKLVSEPCRSCPDQNPVNYLLYSNGILSYLRYLLWCSIGCCSRCMRHVQKCCRYLFWCSVLLGEYELSGGEAAYSRCCRGIFWMEKLSLLWLWFL